MSRRGVAAAIGTPIGTLLGWVERGMAYPGEEPYGSFSADYRRAERGLEGAAAGTLAWVTRRLWMLTQEVDRGERATATELERERAFDALATLLKNPQLKELLNVLANRFPEDWGQSKHRVPEPEFDAQHWLDAHTMDHEQLAALFQDPPEAIRKALVTSADAVYGILLAGGFVPAVKANDETE